MAYRGLGALPRWRRLLGAARVPPTFFPGTTGVASITRETVLIRGSETYGKGCFSSTRISSSKSYGGLTPSEREAFSEKKDPRKPKKLTGEEIREFFHITIASHREYRKGQIVTNQLLETLVKNSTPSPAGWIDNFVAAWGYKLPPKESRGTRLIILLALSFLVYEFLMGLFDKFQRPSE